MDRLTPEQRTVVERNLPLVEHIVKRLLSRFPASCERDDLLQTGILGLIEASSRFDPSKGIAFSTFVSRRIEGAVLDQLRRDDWAPRSVRAGERQLELAEAELARGQGRRPGEVQLSRATGLDPEEIRRLRVRIATASLDSLDRTVGRDDGTVALRETVVDHHQMGVEQQLDERELRGYLRDALHLLPERHRLVIIGHFFEGRSLTELGERLGVTQSRASQLKDDALRLLRTGLRAQYREASVGADPDRRVSARERDYTESLRRAKPWRERLVPAGAALVG